MSATGTAADKRLLERREAMRKAAGAEADSLHCDFYDRERVAIWVNQYPGVAVWVRSRVGRELSGWLPIGNWSDHVVAEDTPYLLDDKACLIDERSHERKKLTIAEGIAALRGVLVKPRQAVRLIGLSGLGKTRLVQALFESGVGERALDPGLAVYADYSDGTTPTAHEMARRLVDTGQRAILIVDNCNPETHHDLARTCTGSRGQVSLITVEYDVRDDEPERTEVFRLENASPELVEGWLKQVFDHVSQVDRTRIAAFSDGNFRVARALAQTLKKGETLGQLKDRALFERIFRQRNDPDQPLLMAAEDLSLLYSFDGEDSSTTGELGEIAKLREVSPLDLFTATVALRRRGIVQARGRWRAVLPHAIANPLAAYALERIPADRFDAFSANLPTRMLTSLSRRLGYLHDSEHARRTVARWMERDGPLGDLLAPGETNLQILRNIAPVAPETVLARIEAEIAGPDGASILDVANGRRSQWISLLKSLAFDAALFERSSFALARFVAAEPPQHGNNSATTAFGELFHLHLSGTHATPEQRRAMIRRLSAQAYPGLRRSAGLALDELLEATHFTSMSLHDFGARSRDFGWQPRLYGDIYSWLDEAITLCIDLADSIDDAGAILARNIRSLWFYRSTHEQLDRAATLFAKGGPWIDGWINFRAALRFEGNGMSDDVRDRLVGLIDRLKPVDILDKARAVVLNRDGGGYDLTDGEHPDVVTSWRKASEQAVAIGRALSADPVLLTTFLPELFAEQDPMRADDFGRGLAQASEPLEGGWALLVDTFAQMPESARNATVLGGFLAGVRERDHDLVQRLMDGAMGNPALLPKLTFLQTRAGLDDLGIMRLISALDAGKLELGDLYRLASGVVGEAPAEPLALLVMKIALGVTGGIALGLSILSMRFTCEKDGQALVDPLLIDAGRALLVNTDLENPGHLGSYGLKGVAETCLSGTGGEESARKLSRRIRSELDAYRTSAHKLGHLFEGLFKVQPAIALDELLLGGEDGDDRVSSRLGRPTPLEAVDDDTLRAWAEIDPARRYLLLGRGLILFASEQGGDDTGLSPKFLALMEHAPDPAAFLGNAHDRMQPRSWSGSLADLLERRRDMLQSLASHPDEAVRAWLAELEKWLGDWIASERTRDSAREESFE